MRFSDRKICDQSLSKQLKFPILAKRLQNVSSSSRMESFVKTTIKKKKTTLEWRIRGYWVADALSCRQRDQFIIPDKFMSSDHAKLFHDKYDLIHTCDSNKSLAATPKPNVKKTKQPLQNTNILLSQQWNLEVQKIRTEGYTSIPSLFFLHSYTRHFSSIFYVPIRGSIKATHYQY